MDKPYMITCTLTASVRVWARDEVDARNELALIIGGAELSVDAKEAGVVSMAIVGTPVIDPLQ